MTDYYANHPSSEEQLPLFDSAGNAHIEPADPRLSAEERLRVSRQAREVLQRLRDGPQLNTELMGISQRFGARIFELRQAGFDIATEYVDKAAGLTRYTLRGS